MGDAPVIGQAVAGERKRCGATRSRGRGLCRSPFLFANGRCRVHGGPSLSGPASPSFVTGYRSKVLPVRLAAKYAAAVRDPALVGLREEIALLDVRMGELIDRLETGESDAGWQAARFAFSEFQAALAAKDQAGMLAPLKRLDTLLKAGAAETSVWREMQRLLLLRRKLVDSENRRLKDMHQMLTTERAMTYAAALVAAVREVVSDQGQLAAIAARIHRLVGPAEDNE